MIFYRDLGFRIKEVRTPQPNAEYEIKFYVQEGFIFLSYEFWSDVTEENGYGASPVKFLLLEDAEKYVKHLHMKREEIIHKI